MKFIIFALIAGLCLLGVHANIEHIEPRSVEYVPNDLAEGGIEFQTTGFLSTTWWILRSALRTVKGLNCLIQWVVGIKSSALQFNAGVVDCGVAAGKEVQAVINANVAIVSTCNDIIHLQSNVCSNEDNKGGKVSGSCFGKALAKIWTLYRQVNKAIALTKKIPTTGVNASQCVVDQVNTLVRYYTQFPATIKQCSKLTN